MEINSINNYGVNQPVFTAKIGSGLKFLVKDDPRFNTFMDSFSKWGDSNSVVDVYNAKINGKTKYMLRLSNKVLDETTVPLQKNSSEFMKQNLINQFFDITEKTIDFVEYNLLKNVVDSARQGGKPYIERLHNIIKSHKKEGIVFDAKTEKCFREL